MLPPRPILATPHFVIVFDAEASILRLTRTSLPFADGIDHEPEIASVEAALRAFDSERVALLSDVREAPPRNDDTFEKTFARIRQRLFGRFIHSAALVRTAVGKLQVARLAVGPEGAAAAVFQSEEAARTHLLNALRK